MKNVFLIDAHGDLCVVRRFPEQRSGQEITLRNKFETNLLPTRICQQKTDKIGFSSSIHRKHISAEVTSFPLLTLLHVESFLFFYLRQGSSLFQLHNPRNRIYVPEFK